MRLSARHKRRARASAGLKTLERHNESGMCKPHRPFQEGGLDQEGSVNDVKVRWRVLRGVDLRPEYFRRADNLDNGQGTGWGGHRNAERNMRSRQNAQSRRRDHVLAAVVFVVGRMARHRSAALHRLLIRGHGLAFSELHHQGDAHGYQERCGLAKHPLGFLNELPFLSLWLLDARVKETPFRMTRLAEERA